MFLVRMRNGLCFFDIAICQLYGDAGVVPSNACCEMTNYLALIAANEKSKFAMLILFFLPVGPEIKGGKFNHQRRVVRP